MFYTTATGDYFGEAPLCKACSNRMCAHIKPLTNANVRSFGRSNLNADAYTATEIQTSRV